MPAAPLPQTPHAVEKVPELRMPGSIMPERTVVRGPKGCREAAPISQPTQTASGRPHSQQSPGAAPHSDAGAAPQPSPRPSEPALPGPPRAQFGLHAERVVVRWPRLREQRRPATEGPKVRAAETAAGSPETAQSAIREPYGVDSHEPAILKPAAPPDIRATKPAAPAASAMSPVLASPAPAAEAPTPMPVRAPAKRESRINIGRVDVRLNPPLPAAPAPRPARSAPPAASNWLEARGLSRFGLRP